MGGGGIEGKGRRGEGKEDVGFYLNFGILELDCNVKKNLGSLWFYVFSGWEVAG